MRYTSVVRCRYRIFLGMGLNLLAISTCVAQSLSMVPSLDLSPEELRARSMAAQTSNMGIGGQGNRLELVYSASLPLQLDIAPRRRGTGFDPVEVLHLTLPPGTKKEAIIDLTPSPGWWPFEEEYILSFFSPAEEKGAEILSMQFLPSSASSVLRAAWRHLLLREEYQVASYHTLRGTNVLGLALFMILGCLTLLLTMIFLLLRRPAAAMGALCACTLLGSTWFSIDLLRFTVQNLSQYERSGIYSHAGAAKALSDAIRTATKGHAASAFVFVCQEDTDFYAKLLRYFAYPIRVSIKPEDIPRATHVVVRTLGWNYVNGILTCGNLSGKATKLATMPDGAVLFMASR